MEYHRINLEKGVAVVPNSTLDKEINEEHSRAQTSREASGVAAGRRYASSHG